MIPARKSPAFSRWFSGDAQRRIFRAFGAVRVGGLDDLARVAAERPVLVISNHTSWWDPLVVLYLTARVLKVDAYAMMDAKNLRALPFFGKVGAFGVNLDTPVDGARAIRYAAKLLDRAGRLVWIFLRVARLRSRRDRWGFAEGARRSHAWPGKRWWFRLRSATSTGADPSRASTSPSGHRSRASVTSPGRDTCRRLPSPASSIASTAH